MTSKSEVRSEDGPLARELNTPLLALYGTGTILGAGIYVLIGKVAGAAGAWTPLAFGLAALVATVNGMALAELSTRSPSAGGPSDYVRQGFGSDGWSAITGWGIVATGVVSAATIAAGFSGYLIDFYAVPEWAARAGLLLVLGGIAVAGVEQSAWFMAVTTSLGLLGLGFVLYVGFFDPGASSSGAGAASELPSLTRLPVLTGVFSATFLAIYAFIGFEDMVHLAEEVREPARAMPRAIAIALAVAAILYVAVSIAALRIVAPDTLDASDAPLVEVVVAAGYPGWPLTLLSLAIILNGALAQLIMATRVVYRLSRKGGAPDWMGRVAGLTSTPVVATALATGVALALALFLPLETLASATSVIILAIFAASNLALIRLERGEPDAPFDTPRWLPWVGLTLSVLLLGGSLVVGGGGH